MGPEKRKKGFLLGGRGGFLLEPVADLADVATEDGGGLLNVASEEEDSGAHADHRQDEVRQCHLLAKTKTKKT